MLQAASAIDSFKIESPVKKISFNASDKENQPLDDASLETLANQMDDTHKPTETAKVDKSENKPGVAPAIKPDEVDEPILQENPQRFVLFPIKYHEVCKKKRDALTFTPDAFRRVKWYPTMRQACFGIPID